MIKNRILYIEVQGTGVGVATVTISKDNSFDDLSKTKEDEIEALRGTIPLCANDCIVLGECRKVVL